MTGNFLEKIFERAKSDSAFADFELVKAYENTAVKYPVKKPYVTFSTEYSKTGTVLIGVKNCEMMSESMIVTVAVDESKGGNFCEEKAKDICIALMKLDSEKMISSVSVEKCTYDKKIFGYRITMKFGLRETGIDFGGE